MARRMRASVRVGRGMSVSGGGGIVAFVLILGIIEGLVVLCVAILRLIFILANRSNGPRGHRPQRGSSRAKSGARSIVATDLTRHQA